MAVKIRLMRMGKKKKPFYRIVVMDSKRPRMSEYIDKVGYYNPVSNPPEVKIDEEKVMEWIKRGAQPSPPVLRLLRKQGIWQKLQNQNS